MGLVVATTGQSELAAVSGGQNRAGVGSHSVVGNSVGEFSLECQWKVELVTCFFLAASTDLRMVGS